MSKRAEPFKILTIDDDESSSLVVRAFLERAGYEVRYADCVAQAKRILQSELPDAILLDIMMPDVDGLTYLKELRKEPAMKSLPVILVSGVDDSENIIDALESGANDYVTKPVDYRVLLARLHVHLNIVQTLKKAEDSQRFYQRLAARDDLTGVLNRRTVVQEVEHEIARSLRYSRPCSLLMVDTDEFKLVNDSAGHETGDEVLRRVVARMSVHLRDPDSLGRYGGDEFCVLLPETDSADAWQVAERLRQAVEQQEVSLHSLTHRVTLSIGVATMVPGSPKSSRRLMAEADTALYQAKSRGRNLVVCYEESTMNVTESAGDG